MPENIEGFAPHFPFKEMIHSETAETLGIRNIPETEAVLLNLKATSWVAEAARTILGEMLIVNSGFRCPELNAAIKGSKTSVHMIGLAVDIKPTRTSISDAVKKLIANRDFMKMVDQIIEERGCIHIGLPKPGQNPRHEYRGEAIVNGARTYPLIEVINVEDD